MSKLKRLAAPKFWPIERKTKKYVVKPSPGPHSYKTCIPLGVVLRDNLNAAESMEEAREILNSGIVRVDGKIRKKHNFPAGFMDVISIGDEHYRVLTDNRGLYLHRIESKEANIKLCRVENKRYARGKLQLNLHDGTNLLSDEPCSAGDVFVLGVPGLAVKDVLKLEKASVALVIKGHNIGKIGKILEIKITRTPQPNQATVSLEGRSVNIPKNFVFVVGREKPAISL